MVYTNRPLRDLSTVLAFGYVFCYLPIVRLSSAIAYLSSLSNTLSLPNRPIRLELVEALPMLQLTAELERVEPIALITATADTVTQPKYEYTYVQNVERLRVLRSIAKEHKIKAWNLCGESKLIERLQEKLGSSYQDVINQAM